MIFKETWQQVLNGTKTQTRRLVREGDIGIHQAPGYAELPIEFVRGARHRLRWRVGDTYAIQPGRGKKAVGRIRITKIRREKLRNISEEDCMAEGIPKTRVLKRFAFEQLWNSLYRKPHRWEDDIECWVLEFERVIEKEGQMEIRSEDLTPDFTIIHRIVDEISKKELSTIEKQFRIRIQPKPCWIPLRIWRWLLGKMLVMTVFEKGGTDG